jgi:8-hydroxy-5-deazaflavin:NADPH oxidoreductase
MKVAVIGSGSVGSALAQGASAAGHEVQVGSRRPEAGVAIGEAVQWADVTIVAVPGGAIADFAASIADRLAGQVIIDASNNVGGGGPISGVETIRSVAPDAHVYRAFNSVGWENMTVDDYDGVRPDMFFAGPDDQTRTNVEQLIGDLGPRPVYVGATPQAYGAVDSLAGLWFALAFDRGHGRRIAFKLLGA